MAEVFPFLRAFQAFPHFLQVLHYLLEGHGVAGPFRGRWSNGKTHRPRTRIFVLTNRMEGPGSKPKYWTTTWCGSDKL